MTSRPSGSWSECGGPPIRYTQEGTGRAGTDTGRTDPVNAVAGDRVRLAGLPGEVEQAMKKLFEMFCEKCGFVFEAFTEPEAIPGTDCPKCGEKKLRRKYSSFAAGASGASCSIGKAKPAG